MKLAAALLLIASVPSACSTPTGQSTSAGEVKGAEPEQLSAEPEVPLANPSTVGKTPLLPPGIFRGVGVSGTEREDYYAAPLAAMKEPPLHNLDPGAKEVYRMLLYPWHHHPCSVRVQVTKPAASLVTRWLRNFDGQTAAEITVDETRAITAEQLAGLEHLLAKAGFWSLQPRSREEPLYYRKEQRLLFEAWKNGRYHAVERRVPVESSPLRELRDYMLALTGDWQGKERLLHETRR